jgi:hypothetical protein
MYRNGVCACLQSGVCNGSVAKTKSGGGGLEEPRAEVSQCRNASFWAIDARRTCRSTGLA